MAKRLFYTGAQTFTAQAYATVLTDGTHASIIGGSTTQMIDFLEFLISGQDTASVVGAYQVCRSINTVAATFTGLASPNSDGPMVPATAALAAAPTAFVASTTKAQASNTVTDAKLNLGINSFGGILRWNASPTQQWQLLGNATGFGVTILFNSSTAGGSNSKASTHEIYEPY